MHVLITGANRGLGLEFVRQYLARGATVHAACRAPDQATDLAALAAGHPGRLNLLAVDVAEPDSIAAMRRQLDRLTDRLHRLVNNAGILVRGERFGQLDPAVMARSHAVNTIGPVLIAQACADLLERGQPARLANISSGLGSIAGVDGFHSPSYNASKAALNMWTRLLAQEMNPRGVLCLALRPGWVRTAMGGEQADLAPADSVAGMIAALEDAGVDDQLAMLGHDGGHTGW